MDPPAPKRFAAPQADPIFDRDKFLLRAKDPSLLKNYWVCNEQGEPILFARRSEGAKWILSIVSAIGAAVIWVAAVFFVMLIAAFMLEEVEASTKEAIGGTILIAGFLGLFPVMIITTVALEPKRRYKFCPDEAKTDALLEVLLDKRMQILTATYILRDQMGRELARLRRSYLHDIVRTRWLVSGYQNRELCVAEELQRPPKSSKQRKNGGLNFLILRGRQTIGEFNLNPTPLNYHVLDMSADPQRTLDRRVALALAVLVDGGASAFLLSWFRGLQTVLWAHWKKILFGLAMVTAFAGLLVWFLQKEKSSEAETHFYSGVALANKGDFDGAITEYRKALLLNPGSFEAHGNLAAVLFHEGDLKGSIHEWRQAIRLRPDDARAHSFLGLALMTEGQLEPAILEFREALHLRSDLAATHVYLGVCLAKKRDFEVAIRELREAVRLEPDMAEAHSSLGTALGDTGDTKGSIVELREAIHLNPQFAGAHFNLGNELSKRGELEEALKEYQTACKLSPKDRASCDASENLAHKVGH